MHAKYQMASVKSSGISWFPHASTSWALTKILLRSKVLEKWLSLKHCSFVKKCFSSCKCSMCLHCVCKVSDGFSQSSGTSWFPRACTIWVLTKLLLRSKVLKKMPKFKTLDIKLLHANIQCVYTVHEKYQKVSVKVLFLMKVDFPMHALSKH